MDEFRDSLGIPVVPLIEWTVPTVFFEEMFDTGVKYRLKYLHDFVRFRLLKITDL